MATILAEDTVLLDTLAARPIGGPAAPLQPSTRRGGGPPGLVNLQTARPKRAGSTSVWRVGMIKRDGFTGLDVLDWSEELDIMCVGVAYRLAPAHPDPAPVENGCAALVLAAEQGGKPGVDPHRPMGGQLLGRVLVGPPASHGERADAGGPSRSDGRIDRRERRGRS